jgi:hypothetical protein
LPRRRPSVSSNRTPALQHTQHSRARAAPLLMARRTSRRVEHCRRAPVHAPKRLCDTDFAEADAAMVALGGALSFASRDRFRSQCPSSHDAQDKGPPRNVAHRHITPPPRLSLLLRLEEQIIRFRYAAAPRMARRTRVFEDRRRVSVPAPQRLALAVQTKLSRGGAPMVTFGGAASFSSIGLYPSHPVAVPVPVIARCAGRTLT